MKLIGLPKAVADNRLDLDESVYSLHEMHPIC